MDPTDPTNNMSKDNISWPLLKNEAQNWLHSLRQNESPGPSWNVLVRGLPSTTAADRARLPLGLQSLQDHPNLVSQSRCDKVPCTGRLKQQKCIPSQFWGLEGQDRGISRTALPLTAPRKSASMPLPASHGCQKPLACGSVTPVPTSVVTRTSLVSSQCLPSMLVCFSVSLLFLKDTGHTE